MSEVLISTKIFGLRKADVDAYVLALANSYKDKLGELIKEKKLLERTKQKLLIELSNIDKNNVIYEDVYEDATVESGKNVDEAAANAEKTILLINGLADQKIEQMISRAKQQVSEYDAALERLNSEMDENREKIERLLAEVVTLLQSNISEVFSAESGSSDENKVIESEILQEHENVINFFEKKNTGENKTLSVVPKDIEEKMISNLRTYNDIKAGFLRHLDAIIAKNSASKGAVLLVEINNLLIASYLNRYSEEDALVDRTIKGISNLGYDLHIVRLSYDQIAIILEGINEASSVSRLADKIMQQISREEADDERKTALSANIGISLYPQNATDSETILNCAAIALFKAKEKGKSNYEFINDELIREIKLTGEFKQDLTDAVENDELEIFYQPQISSDDDNLVGFEALLRWRNEKYNNVPILQIIQLAEREDLISAIGTLVFEKACGFARRINENNDRNLIVSVNFSNVQISKSDFLDTVQNVLSETGVAPRHIGFEITESCFMECFGDNCTKIQQLKEMGVTILIDDFGTGYSTLSYLINLPVSIVKIDKTFLDNITMSERNANFVSSIIDISHDLGLKVIAEGIENEKQRNMLAAMGCDILQGYLISKPVPEAEAIKFL